MTAVVDSHCHAWARWPYLPPVPDEDSRARVEQLIFQMDINGVDRAVVVCARIDKNPDNNDYVAEAVRRYPLRLVQFADVDSFWLETYHRPGADIRLREAVERYALRGFTHYLHPSDPGDWLHSEDGLAFFRVASEHRLIASIACAPHHQPAIRRVAERFPEVPILCHHMGGIRAEEGPPFTGLKEVLASARLANVHIKLSGFHHASVRGWDFPCPDALWLARTLYEHYGPYRLCWGSDFPVVTGHLTYRQSLEVVRTHCTFIAPQHLPEVLGGNLQRLLEGERP